MDSSDARGMGRLLARALAGGASRVQETHRGIAARAFAGVGPAATPVQGVHDLVADATYATVRGFLFSGAVVAGLAAGEVADRRAAGDPLADGKAGGLLLAALNGAVGDLLEREVAELATTMSLRHRGRPLSPDRDALAAAHPAAGGRIAVWVHGLVENEGAWHYRAAHHHGRPGVTYGSLLRDDLGLTPLWVRYNTGLPVAENGERLARLLDRVVAAWPVPVEDVVLVGHSMGGLVVRQAARHTTRPDLIRATVALGTPHTGAPTARAAHVAEQLLARLGETQALHALVALRSAGIKDLVHGNHPLVPPHVDAQHLAVVASVAGGLAGDGVVGARSAAGDVQRVARVPGLHHLDLLNHPRVHVLLRDWLAGVLPARARAG